MAKPRTELQSILEDILGSRNVYFQPPESLRMSYPAIVYSLSSIDNIYASDSIFRRYNVYEIVLIDRSPESTFVDPILNLPFCRFTRSYKAENLNHYAFTIYF